ncbi:MAG: hypothetical protein QRY74_00180 [Chlamydia sp.]
MLYVDRFSCSFKDNIWWKMGIASRNSPVLGKIAPAPTAILLLFIEVIIQPIKALEAFVSSSIHLVRYAATRKPEIKMKAWVLLKKIWLIPSLISSIKKIVVTTKQILFAPETYIEWIEKDRELFKELENEKQRIQKSDSSEFLKQKELKALHSSHDIRKKRIESGEPNTPLNEINPITIHITQ